MVSPRFVDRLGSGQYSRRAWLVERDETQQLARKIRASRLAKPCVPPNLINARPILAARRISRRLLMSNAQNAYGGANNDPGAGPQAWTYGHGACAPGRGWTAFELAAMVLGFIVFWPIGLAILGYKLWQRKMGGPDLKSLADEGWRWARDTFSGASAGPARAWTANAWTPGSGNSAFDAWKAAEIARLEEERRKLETAHREFKEFLDTVRKAKDREEFERFMNDRRNRQGA